MMYLAFINSILALLIKNDTYLRDYVIAWYKDFMDATLSSSRYL